MNPFNYLRNVILQHFKKILNTIHILYPNIITVDINDMLYKHVKTTLKFYNLTEDRNIMLELRCKRKIFKRTIRNHGISLHIRKPAASNIRCKARIWAQGKICTNEKGELIYGEQCYRSIYKNEGKYCFQHKVNNKHGDFNAPVTPEYLYNLKKNRKLLQKA
jgi:hypothetical protein